SSRRRHTRFSRDWSSDVCSSDLNYACSLSLLWPPVYCSAVPRKLRKMSLYSRFPPQLSLIRHALNWARSCGLNLACPVLVSSPRSEERRVGKECSSRGSTAH